MILNDPYLMLTLAYVALATLLLIAALASTWALWKKMLLIAATGAMFFLGHFGHQSLQGWASSEAMPERFVLLATVIEEPRKDKNDPGRIFVWVNPLLDNKPAAEPRAYRLPYEKDLHALLGEAMKRNRQGITQLGRTEPQPGAKGLSWMRGATQAPVKLKITDMPKAQLPEK